MDVVSRLHEILSKTIGELAKVSSEAAVQQDFVGSNLANSVAVSLREIAERHNTRETSTTGPSAHNAAAKQRPQTRTQGPKQAKSGRNEYPKFFVRNGTLYRVGWSKKGKSEYTHKVPRAVFDQVVQAMAHLARKSPGPHSGENIMDELGRHQAEVPAYQMYVTLALLHKRDRINKKGREGYILPTGIMEIASGVWEECE